MTLRVILEEPFQQTARPQRTVQNYDQMITPYTPSSYKNAFMQQHLSLDINKTDVATTTMLHDS